MIKFKSTKEFNEAWGMFVAECGWGRWKMPKCSKQEQVGLRYLESERFKWLARCFSDWVKYAKNYLTEQNDL